MPRDSNGNTVPLPGTIVATGDTVLPSQHNPMVNDVYAMMTQSLSRDGQGGMRANLDMHGFRILNVGTATQPTDAVSLRQLQNGTPVGAVIDFAGSSAPSTWMFAYGQAVSRTTYPVLFAAIGTTYGNGNGSTTFNLPDLRGRVIAGKDNMGGSDARRLSFFGAVARSIGGVLGADAHKLTNNEMPAHNHSGNTGGGGTHNHASGLGIYGQLSNLIAVFGRTTRGSPGQATYGIRNSAVVDEGPINQQALTETVGNHTHSITTQGGGAEHNNAQPTMIMNKIIKVSY